MQMKRLYGVYDKPVLQLKGFSFPGKGCAAPYFSGHYSEKGNQAVARLIYNRLKQARRPQNYSHKPLRRVHP